MDIEREYKIVRNMFLCGIIACVAVSGTACTVQWAIRNKNTDCGFTNDKISPGGHKDPAIFYGPSRAKD